MSYKVSVRYDFHVQPGGHRMGRAVCTCGWTSGRVPDTAARASASTHELTHRPLVNEPPDGGAALNTLNAESVPPECPNGCGCRWLDDADRSDCACDGPCCFDEWDTLPDGTFRPGSVVFCDWSEDDEPAQIDGSVGGS